MAKYLVYIMGTSTGPLITLEVVPWKKELWRALCNKCERWQPDTKDGICDACRHT